MSDQDPEQDTETFSDYRKSRRDRVNLLPVIGSIIILGTFALVVAEFLETGVIEDSTARLLLAAGIIIMGGKEAINAIVERFAK